MMKYTDFPGTKEKVSVLGLGTWVFGGENWGGADDEACIGAVHEAMALGVNFIDTAPFYTDGKAEQLVGQAIRGRRDKVFIATKCGLVRENGRVRHDLSPASIRHEVGLSLRRLQCDVIDLYMCHWPDPGIAIEKTMETLIELRDTGKIRHIGVSNFDLGLLRRACAVAPVATLQVPYSLLDRGIENGLLAFCREQGIGIIAYGAMGGGILTGKYVKPPTLKKSDARKMFYTFYEGENFEKTKEALNELKALGKPLNQLVLNWVRQQPGVMTVLAGCRDMRQVKENMAAVDWDLSTDEFEKINKVKISA
ncbi:MAG: aldo/keto reductase [Candidatus Omnitrophica bacterium]|nr:aldo/keto reductase [Candidatus Omnitrophota bacterium]